VDSRYCEHHFITYMAALASIYAPANPASFFSGDDSYRHDPANPPEVFL